ncbi:MAG: transglutaminase family protein [Pseudomonadota bacterium]
MMRLSIRHETRYQYETPPTRAAMRLRLFPTDYDTQTVENWRVSVLGDTVEPNVRDGFCVDEAVWTREERLPEISVVAEGVVQRAEDAGVVRGLKERAPADLFLRDTPLTEPNDAVRDLAEPARGGDALAVLHALSAAVRGALDFETASTNMGTTAVDALEQGKGVCQDFAHVFIAAARHLEIPARYVAGYFHPDGDEELRETHGWAEGWCAGLGWVGFDVANAVCPTPAYVRLVTHLDASRAALIRGAIVGDTSETLETHVEITQTQQ